MVKACPGWQSPSCRPRGSACQAWARLRSIMKVQFFRRCSMAAAQVFVTHRMTARCEQSCSINVCTYKHGVPSLTQLQLVDMSVLLASRCFPAAVTIHAQDRQIQRYVLLLLHCRSFTLSSLQELPRCHHRKLCKVLAATIRRRVWVQSLQ